MQKHLLAIYMSYGKTHLLAIFLWEFLWECQIYWVQKCLYMSVVLLCLVYSPGTIVRSRWEDPKKNLNNFAILHPILTQLAPIDWPWKCTSYTVNLLSYNLKETPQTKKLFIIKGLLSCLNTTSQNYRIYLIWIGKLYKRYIKAKINCSNHCPFSHHINSSFLRKS